MKLFNDLTRKKEEFVPIEPGKIIMYVCGPTVYDYFHLGNARTFIVFDTMRRYFEYRGYDVTFVQNFTDIDDKMINRANDEHITVKELGDRFISEYYKDADALNIERATVNPRATQYIGKIIKFVKGLVDKGYAYEVDGDVYFSTKKFKDYGKLSGQNIEDLQAGARINVDERKKDPMDFAIWKSQKPGEPAWNSPWGMGRPGWHIECSCMSNDILGDTIDIHGGGHDLIFPHHENEIAQSEAYSGKKFVNYWMHAAFLNINNMKMSKSLHNFKTVREILGQYDADVIRFLLVSGHYRQQLNFSEELLDSAKASVERLYNTICNLENIIDKAESRETTAEEISYIESLDGFRQKYIEKMDDDFNTADAITVLFELSKHINSNVTASSSKEAIEKSLSIMRELGGPLGILQNSTKVEVDDEIAKLVEERQQARKDKNYALADRIRDQLKEMNIVIEDTPDGIRGKRV